MLSIVVGTLAKTKRKVSCDR